MPKTVALNAKPEEMENRVTENILQKQWNHELMYIFFSAWLFFSVWSVFGVVVFSTVVCDLFFYSVVFFTV